MKLEVSSCWVMGIFLEKRIVLKRYIIRPVVSNLKVEFKYSTIISTIQLFALDDGNELQSNSKKWIIK